MAWLPEVIGWSKGTQTQPFVTNAHWSMFDI